MKFSYKAIIWLAKKSHVIGRHVCPLLERHSVLAASFGPQSHIRGCFLQVLHCKENPSLFIYGKVTVVPRLMSEPRTLSSSTAALWSRLLCRRSREFIQCSDSYGVSRGGLKQSWSSVKVGIKISLRNPCLCAVCHHMLSHLVPCLMLVSALQLSPTYMEHK